MAKYIKANFSSIDQVIGEKLIGVEKGSKEHSIIEDSDTITLEFTNGKEICIYFVRGEIMVEGD